MLITGHLETSTTGQSTHTHLYCMNCMYMYMYMYMELHVYSTLAKEMNRMPTQPPKYNPVDL